MSRRIFLLLCAIIFLSLLIACGAPPSPTPTPIFVLPTQGIAEIPTDNPPTTVIPSNSTEPSPTLAVLVGTPYAATPPANVPPAATIAPGKISIKIFLVAIDDNGKSGKKIGCNDSVIAVERLVPETLGVLTAALNELFSIHERNLGGSGLYNSLYQSTLKLDGAAVINGRATIAISGKLVRGGVCDDPRVKSQIEETALQFATVKSVAVTLNGVPLDKALSEK